MLFRSAPNDELPPGEPGEQLPPWPPYPVFTVTVVEGVTAKPVARTMPPPPPPPPVGVLPLDIPPPPPPATTKTSTELIPAGTVQLRVVNCCDVVGVVGAVANTTTHAPAESSVAVTPVATSTVDRHAPDPTVAAWTGLDTPPTVRTATAVVARVTATIRFRMRES